MVLSNVIVDVIQLTLTLKMTTAQVVETSVTVNNYVHPHDQTQPTFEMTPGFKPFTVSQLLISCSVGDSDETS